MLTLSFITLFVLSYLAYHFSNKDPKRKIKSQLESLYKQSVTLQRNGNLKEFGTVMEKIHDLEKQL